VQATFPIPSTQTRPIGRRPNACIGAGISCCEILPMVWQLIPPFDQCRLVSSPTTRETHAISCHEAQAEAEMQVETAWRWLVNSVFAERSETEEPRTGPSFEYASGREN